MARNNKTTKTQVKQRSIIKAFIWRFLFIGVLLLAIYNPTKFSLYHWTFEDFSTWENLLSSGKALTWALMIIVFGTMFWWSLRSIGLIGKFCVIVVAGLAAYMLYSRGILNFNNPDVWMYGGQLVLNIMLTIGTLYSRYRKREAGIGNTEDADT